MDGVGTQQRHFTFLEFVYDLLFLFNDTGLVDGRSIGQEQFGPSGIAIGIVTMGAVDVEVGPCPGIQRGIGIECLCSRSYLMGVEFVQDPCVLEGSELVDGVIVVCDVKVQVAELQADGH